jgi:hypothetical protein
MIERHERLCSICGQWHSVMDVCPHFPEAWAKATQEDDMKKDANELRLIADDLWCAALSTQEVEMNDKKLRDWADHIDVAQAENKALQLKLAVAMDCLREIVDAIPYETQCRYCGRMTELIIDASLDRARRLLEGT